MKKLLFVILSLFILVSCDDGDIITEELDFQDTFNSCGELVFYKIKEDPAESLSLQITSPSITFEDLLEVEDDGTLTYNGTEFTINGTTNTFNYRRYNVTPNNFFCNDVPPSNITITNDEESTTGTATVYVSLVEDDNDGIPAELEDLNGNGDLTDDDFDDDGIPNYIDEDDDGDNVLTKNEIDTENLDEDDNPLTSPLDTDGNGMPNYLDKDDDGDGVDTINEENSDTLNNDPSDDSTNGIDPDYLNSSESNPLIATAYRDHVIQQVFKITIDLTSLDLPSITYDTLPFGTLEDSRLITERTIEDLPFP